MILTEDTPIISPQNTRPEIYRIDANYDKNERPSSKTMVTFSLHVSRMSAVDEAKGEISFDVFLEIEWVDKRITIKSSVENQTKDFTRLRPEDRQLIWIPDLYIGQLSKMTILSVLDEISSLRLYNNSTVILNIGATITIKCDMDFSLYPLDVQKCPVDFSSYQYDVDELQFSWKLRHNQAYGNYFEEKFNLPRYLVSFITIFSPHTLSFKDLSSHSAARMEIRLSRELKSYLLEYYLPSTLFVSMSWGSFIVLPDIVPGRMVLLVTTLLALITMFDTVRTNSPDSLRLKSLEVWIICCCLFVFLALLEYLVILFGIRYARHWQQLEKSERESVILPRPRTPPTSINLERRVTIAARDSRRVSTIQRNGLDEVAHFFNSNVQKEQNPEENYGDHEEEPPPSQSPQPYRLRKNIKFCILYAGSSRGRMDQFALVIFPITFVVFTAAYWSVFLAAAAHKR